MPKRKENISQFKCSLKPKIENACDKVSIAIDFFNNSTKNYYISRDALMLDGFVNDKFSITLLDACTVIPYKGKYVKYRPEDILFPDNSTITVNLDLTEAYDFQNLLYSQKEYKISFHTIFIPCVDLIGENCDDIVTINEAINITMGC